MKELGASPKRSAILGQAFSKGLRDATAIERRAFLEGLPRNMPEAETRALFMAATVQSRQRNVAGEAKPPEVRIREAAESGYEDAIQTRVQILTKNGFTMCRAFEKHMALLMDLLIYKAGKVDALGLFIDATRWDSKDMAVKMKYAQAAFCVSPATGS